MAFRKYYYNLNVELSDEGSGNTMSFILNKADLEELISDLTTEFILLNGF
jgi:hypothetical protein